MSFNFVKEMELNATGDGAFTFFKKGFLINGKLSPSYIDVILSGVSPLVLTKAIGLNYVKLFGATEQTGTPTPDTPIDIVCNNGVLKLSPNLFNKDLVPDINVYVNRVNGNINNPSSGEFRSSDYITIKEKTQYYVGIVNSIASSEGLAFYDDTKTYISGVSLTQLGENNNIITSPANAKYIRFSFSIDEGYNTNWQNTVYFIEGNQPLTEFIPYGSIYADGTQETVSVTGKNLYDGTITHFAYLANDRVVTYNQEYMGITVPVKAGETYTFSRQYLPESKSTNRFNFYYTQEYPRVGVDVYNASSAPTNSLTQTFTVPNNMNYVVFYFDIGGTDISNTKMMVELGTTATEYESYFNGGSANAEMLLGVGDYKDEQNITSGAVTRNVGVMVLDGSIGWTYKSLGSGIARVYIRPTKPSDTDLALCSHAALTPISERTLAKDPNTFQFGILASDEAYLGFKLNESEFADATAWKQYLADQYANGTPVIIIYPLAEPTTESVTGQPLSVQQGTNIVSITQASINGLEIEVSYKQSN